MRRTTLTHRLRDTLQAEAGRIAGPEEDPVEEPTAQPRRRWVLVAAALVVVMGAATVAIARRSDHPADVDTRTEDTETTLPQRRPPIVPDGALAPRWVPDGLAVWEVMWSQPDLGARQALGKEQLFGRNGRTDDGALYVRLMPSAATESPSGDVTVQGHPASVQPAKEFGDTTSVITWHESGVQVDVEFVGLDLGEAVAVVNTWSWRSSVRTEGFAPPTGGGFAMLGETTAAPDGTVVHSSSFLYLDAELNRLPGEGHQLRVDTQTAGGGPAIGFLTTWFHGSARADGSVESYDPQYGSLRRSWPDGRGVYLDANSTPIDRPTLTRIADSIAPISGVELVALRDETADRLATTLPLTASAAFDVGTLEVRGDGYQVSLCLVVADGGKRLCPPPTGAGDDQFAGVLVHGNWYLIAAERGATPRFHESGSNPLDPAVPELPGQVPVTDGEWTFVVLANEPGVAADVWFDSSASGPMIRPDW